MRQGQRHRWLCTYTYLPQDLTALAHCQHWKHQSLLSGLTEVMCLQWVLNPAASAFYEEAGSAAAALGISVSIFAASARTCGLHAMQALVEGSGGCMRLYPSLQEAAMPQVQRPQASQPTPKVGKCNCL